MRTWEDNKVCEYDEARHRGLKEKTEVHFGRVFQMCTEKHSEDEVLRRYKGRVVFQGNKVTDQSATMAVFQEIRSSACLLTASKLADAIAASPGNSGQQSDAPRAYTQAVLRGILTLIELPREQWPKHWFDENGQPKYRRPVCPLRLALYRHPLPGVFWEEHCNKGLSKCGFGKVPSWEQCFYHPART